MADHYGKWKISKSAAALSYYLIMSVFPAALILNGFLGVLNISESDFLNMAQGLFPADVLNTIYDYILGIRSDSSIFLNLTAVYVILVSLSAAIRVYRHTNEQIMQETPVRGLISWVISFLLALGMLLVLFLSCVLMMCGKWLLGLLARPAEVGRFYGLWVLVRFCIMLLVLFFSVWSVYALSNRRRRLGQVWPGAIFSALVLVASNAVFSHMVSLSMKYQLIYGSLASLIIMMLWFNLFGNILFVGSIINVVLEEKRQERWKKPKR